MIIRFLLMVLIYASLLQVNLFAFEVIVYPEKTPLGGLNLSKGVIVVNDTGDILSLTSEGYCLIDIPPEHKEITVGIYVPGFQVSGGTYNASETVEIPIVLQQFVGKEVVIDLGESASMVLASRAIIEDVTKVVKENQEVDILNPPPEAPATMNPFFVIELVVGKSMSEILGMEKSEN